MEPGSRLHTGQRGVCALLCEKDIRAREEFSPGCQLCCQGVPVCQSGTVIRIDADGRLAMVDWGCGMVGWWYLKDLKIIGYYLTQRRQERKEILMNENYSQLVNL